MVPPIRLQGLCHWQSTWQICSNHTVNQRKKFVSEQLPFLPQSNSRPTVGDFITNRSELKGTYGPDFWSTEEAQVFPQQICNWFHNITKTWEEHGTLPSGLTYSKKINIPKPSKLHNNATQAADLRPITIYSNWYRWWASTWAKSSVIKTWRAQASPPNIIGGAESRGAESMGSQICSQCYDNVHPSLATTALRQFCLPKGLCEVLHTQWTHQKRFLTWNNHVDPVPLQSYQSMPQGDPLSPLALNAMMLAGLNFTNQHNKTNNPCTQTVYMDDRTLLPNSPISLINLVKQWKTFSETTGLRENQNKLQLTYHSEQHIKRLLHTTQGHPDLQNKISVSIRMLEVCAMCSKLRHTTPKGDQRFEAAMATCNKIRVLPTSHNIKMETARATCISKVTYGWAARSPPQGKQNKLNTAIRNTSVAFNGASPSPYRLLTAGNRQINVVVGVKQVLLMAQRFHYEHWTQHYMSQSLLYKEATTFLHSTGWQQRGLQWHHSELQTSFDLTRIQDKEARKGLAHWLREAWRGAVNNGNNLKLATDGIQHSFKTRHMIPCVFKRHGRPHSGQGAQPWQWSSEQYIVLPLSKPERIFMLIFSKAYAFTVTRPLVLITMCFGTALSAVKILKMSFLPTCFKGDLGGQGCQMVIPRSMLIMSKFFLPWPKMLKRFGKIDSSTVAHEDMCHMVSNTIFFAKPCRGKPKGALSAH